MVRKIPGRGMLLAFSPWDLRPWSVATPGDGPGLVAQPSTIVLAQLFHALSAAPMAGPRGSWPTLLVLAVGASILDEGAVIYVPWLAFSTVRLALGDWADPGFCRVAPINWTVRLVRRLACPVSVGFAPKTRLTF